MPTSPSFSCSALSSREPAGMPDSASASARRSRCASRAAGRDVGPKSARRSARDRIAARSAWAAGRIARVSTAGFPDVGDPAISSSIVAGFPTRPAGKILFRPRPVHASGPVMAIPEEIPVSRRSCFLLAPWLLLPITAGGAGAQSRPHPALDPAATAAGPRPIPGPAYETGAVGRAVTRATRTPTGGPAPRPPPGPVYETAPFSRAVTRGTRTRPGVPGPRYWVQHPRYAIRAVVDAAHDRLSGEETVVYVNHSPDSLPALAVCLRQNVFAAGVPRRQAVPITGGISLSRVAVNGSTLRAAPDSNPAMPLAAPLRPPPAGEYAVDGTGMTD